MNPQDNAPRMLHNQRDAKPRRMHPLHQLSFAILIIITLILTTIIYTTRADMGNPEPHYNAAPPAFGAGGDTTVPANVEMRSVFGSLTLSPTAISAANVTISICGGVVLENFNDPPISGNTVTWNYAFTVTGGDCYRFNNNIDPSGSNKISSYNYVDVANESFESQAHFNATACVADGTNCPADDDSMYCLLAECANSTYLNETPLKPTGLRITNINKYLGTVAFHWDANSTREGDTIEIGFDGPSSCCFAFANAPGESLASFVENCLGRVDVWSEDPVTLAESAHESVNYDCNKPVDAADAQAVQSLTAQLLPNDTVSISWVSGTTAGAFEVFGNDTTSVPDVWMAYNNATFVPDYYFPTEPNPHIIYVPASDFSAGTTYLRAVWYNEPEDAQNVTDFAETTSCEVTFLLDQLPHSCGIDLVGGGNTTYLNQSVNASGETFLPILFGTVNENAGMGDNITGGSPRLSETGAQISVTDAAPSGTFIVSPFPNAEALNYVVPPQDTPFTMTRNGTFLTADIEAIGPYEDDGCCPDPIAVPSREGISLLIEFQKNNVTIGSATWAAGEKAIKNINLTGGAFVAGDNFRLVLTPSTTAPVNTTYFNLVEATYGILWEGNGGGGGGGSTTVTIANFTYFNQPYIITIPYLIGAALLFLAFLYGNGLWTNLGIFILSLATIFSVVLSKPYLDAVAPYLTVIIGIVYLAITLLNGIKLFRPNINKA